MPPLSFTVSHREPGSDARAAVLETPHGLVATPAFMPVGTAGTVKGIAAWELERLAPQMILANTYHLLLRPGVDRLRRLGGLHRLMGWSGPILTDSGGYQVFSLAGRRRVTEDGVLFRSHIDGAKHSLTPESVVAAQAAFGVDVAMVLDECLPFPVASDAIAPSVDRTLRWARRALDQSGGERESGWRGGLFAIQQGGLCEAERRRCSEELVGKPFDGFAIGGLAVGESSEQLYDAVDFSAPLLPLDRPRYLMGVGYPEDLLHAVSRGVDLFDCVLPDTVGADRQGLHPQRRHQHQECALGRRRPPARQQLPVPDVPALFEGGVASFLHLPRGDVGRSAHDAQPVVFSLLDAGSKGGYHGGPLRQVPSTDRRRPGTRTNRRRPENEVNMGGEAAAGSPLGMMMPLLLVLAVFYFIVIMPAKKQQKKKEAMISALKKGDRVITSGGIHGTVAAVEDDEVLVKVAENVKLRVSKSAVAGTSGGPVEP